MKRIVLILLAVCCLLCACAQQSSASAAATPETRAASAPVTHSYILSSSAEPMGVLRSIQAQTLVEAEQGGKRLSPLGCLGVFLAPQSPGSSNNDVYVLDDEGALTLAESSLFNDAYSIDGLRYRFNFQWSDIQGQAALSYTDPEAKWEPLLLSGGDGGSLVFLIRDHQDGESGVTYSRYPVEIDLETGELKELLDGVSSTALTSITNIALSDGGKGMLLAQEGGVLYYVDLERTTIYSLDELSSQPVRGCSLVGGRLICWNQSPDENGGSIGEYKFWYIDLETMERREMPELETEVDLGALRFAHLAGFGSGNKNGVMFSGSRYALCTQGDGKIFVLDLYEWTLRQVLGYTLPASNVTCTGSFDGQRLLLKDVEKDTAVVLDYATMAMLRLQIQDAESLSWFGSSALIESSQDSYSIYDISDLS